MRRLMENRAAKNRTVVSPDLPTEPILAPHPGAGEPVSMEPEVPQIVRPKQEIDENLLPGLEETPVRPFATISPGAIISRAAAMVPENLDPDSDKSQIHPVSVREEETLILGRETSPNRRAKRRPSRLIAQSTLLNAYRLRHVALLLLIFGIPIWLWQSGRIDTARSSLANGASAMIADVRQAMGLRLKHVYVDGRKLTRASALAQALAMKPGKDVTNIDLETVRARVIALPWVAFVTVQRRLPDALYISIKEHKPIARLKTGGRVILVGAKGAIIPVSARSSDRRLLLLEGKQAPAKLTELLNLLAMAPHLGRRVRSAQRLGARRWNLRFDNGVVLMLPDTSVTESWLRFAKLEGKHRLLARGAKIFDMRLTDRLVIRTGRGSINPDGSSG
jgi:cell division protein FtsQ